MAIVAFWLSNSSVARVIFVKISPAAWVLLCNESSDGKVFKYFD